MSTQRVFYKKVPPIDIELMCELEPPLGYFVKAVEHRLKDMGYRVEQYYEQNQYALKYIWWGPRLESGLRANAAQIPGARITDADWSDYWFDYYISAHTKEATFDPMSDHALLSQAKSLNPTGHCMGVPVSDETGRVMGWIYGREADMLTTLKNAENHRNRTFVASGGQG